MMTTRVEWNDPHDVSLVRRTFDAWAAAVIAKNRPLVESFHDEGFRVTLERDEVRVNRQGIHTPVDF